MTVLYTWIILWPSKRKIVDESERLLGSKEGSHCSLHAPC